MKTKHKLKKVVFSTVIVFLLIGILGALTLTITTKSMQADFKILKTQEVISDVYALNDTIVNSYLVKIGLDKYIAIDAGNKSESLSEELEKLDISPDKIIAVFLTHSDYDHTGGISVFKNADVYLPEKEVKMIDGSTSRNLFLKNKLEVKYKVIKDQEEVAIGDTKVKAILSNGHTTGHSSYLINAEYLFVADSLKIENGKAIPFPKIANMNEQAALESIERLKALAGIKYTFTGHYGFSENYDKLFSQ